MTSPVTGHDIFVRLREQDEFGLLLRNAEPPPLTEERLAGSKTIVRAATVGLGVAAATAAKTATAGTSTIGVAVKITIIAAVALGIAGKMWPSAERPHRAGAQVSNETQVQSAPAVLVPRSPAPVTAPPVTAPSDRPVATPARETPIVKPVALPPAHAERTLPKAPAASPEPKAASPEPSSDLVEQIAIYSDARVAAAHGDYARAVAHLDHLLERFPSSAISAEAELGRADYLARGGRLDAAAAAIERLIARGSENGRRGELEQLLGDLRLKQGDCVAARPAYRAALDAGVAERAQQAIRRALERCPE